LPADFADLLVGGRKLRCYDGRKIGVLCSWLTIAGALSVPATSATVSPAPAGSAETLIWDGKAMPLGTGQAADPAVFKLGNQWLAYFTTVGWKQTCANPSSYQYVVKMASASLPAGQGPTASGITWNLIADTQGGIAAPIPLGGNGAWDQDATETPNVVTGYDRTQQKNVTRLYYTGWKRADIGTNASGCPNLGYSEMKIGMAEWDNTCNCWKKRAGPVIDGVNSVERMHYRMPDGSLVTYSMIGDQSVIYIPGANNSPGLWHAYYQANSDLPYPQVNTIHATSTDGVNWPASNKTVLKSKPPYATATLPGGPYHIDVNYINGKFYFSGWIPGSTQANQGLWVVSSTTADGSAAGDFTDWRPLLYDSNGTWWHDPGPNPSSHDAGLFSPTLILDGGVLSVYYSGTRQESSGLWSSVGRAAVAATILQ
jgi:hypothetical protein